MSSGWPRVALGSVTTQVREVVKVEDGNDYPLLGVRWYAQGAFLRETVTSETSKAKTLNRVRPGLFIYNRLFAWKGSFGLVTDDLAGSYVSNEFPLFECDASRLLPEYLALFFGQPVIWDQIEKVSTGTTASRNRWKEEAFDAFTVPLPSLAEQRHIVDLVNALQDAIDRAEDHLLRVRGTYEAWLASLAERHALRPLSSVVSSAYAGGTPSRDHDEYFGGDIPWVKSGEVDADDIRTSAECITAEGLKRSSAKWVQPGSTLVAMYGQGDTKGRAGFVGAEVTTNQAVLALEPDRSQIDERYLFHAVRSRTKSLRTRAVGAAQPNLSKALVTSEMIPVPFTLDAQRVEVDVLDALLDLARASQAQVTAMRELYTPFVTSLVSGSHAVPDSYEALLREAS